MSLARKKMGQKKSQSLGSDVKCHITLRVSKLPMFKVWLLRDLNPGLLRESLNRGKSTHAGGPGSNPGQAEI